ncbi:MAG: hypothetical protein ABI772_11385, partial [Bacteroidota bacterium]
EKCNVQCSFNYNTQSLEIKSDCITASAINVDFYNATGQLTASQKLIKNSEGNFSSHKTLLPQGLTLYIITTDDGMYSGKIVY